MATELPEEPKSRKEQYLADIAGQDVELPAEPKSREEQYLAYIAENGGGGGGGGTSNFNQLSNRPKYNGTTMTGDTNIPEVKTYTAGSNITISGNEISATDTKYTAGANVSISDQNVISATDTTYSAFTGTDGTAAGTAGLVPAPATTDAGKFLKADGTWDTAGGGTSYTAGDGIDITNAVISATNTGKAKILTTDDYNWPTSGTKTSVNLSLLPAGIYYRESNSVVESTGLSGDYLTFVVGQKGAHDQVVIALGKDNDPNGSPTLSRRYHDNNFQNSTKITPEIVDSLTSTKANATLSAAQGKVLKDLVDSLAVRGAGAPTTSTAGQVGTLYEDTTNGDLYICTDATNPYVWEEVGAGGSSGITELTSADYNYDYGSTGTNNAVALWLLDSGIYSVKEPNIPIRISTGSGWTTAIGNFIVGAETTDTQSRKLILYQLRDDNGAYHDGEVIVRASNGNHIDGKLLDPPTVVQTTGTSTTDVMSQNAVTSMVFADPSTKYKVQIGGRAYASGSYATAVGELSSATGTQSVALGLNATSKGNFSVNLGAHSGNTEDTAYANTTAIGYNSVATGGVGAVAVGAYSKTSAAGEMNIGSTNTSYGYNSSNYRLLTGLYDGQSAHDAATYGQMNTRLGGLTLVSISQTDYDNLQTKDANTLYVITGA